MNKQPAVCIVIPCFNEAERLKIDAFETFSLNSNGHSVDLLFVNDGSEDETGIILDKLCNENSHCSVLNLKHNSGKAEAIRQGVNSVVTKGLYDYIGYFDADLATPLSEAVEMIRLTTQKPYLIAGSRVKILGQTTIDRKFTRHIIGRLFATVVSSMLELAVYDTQCGAKLIKADVAKKVFAERFLSKWLFDVELFFRLKANFPNYKTRIIEHPVRSWRDVAGSKIKASYFLLAPFDLLKIYLKYK